MSTQDPGGSGPADTRDPEPGAPAVTRDHEPGAPAVTTAAATDEQANLDHQGIQAQEADQEAADRAALAEEEARIPRWQRLVGANTALILGVLVALLAIFAAARPASFATVPNLRNVATDASTLLVVAVGMTFVIITSGIDLSVGSVLVFSGVIAAKAMEAIGGESLGVILLGLFACMLSGLAWGIVNGVLIAKGRIPPLIVTLGTLGMALGAAQLITGGVNLRTVPTNLTLSFGIGQMFSIPYIVLVAVVVALIGAWLLFTTRFGRYTYAIGSNEDAARRAGINVDRHLIKVYAMSGFLAGLAGFLSLARFATTNIGGETTLNLQAITAVVLGGTSLFGGIGTIVGTVIGVFIPAVLQNGFVILGVQPFWQSVAVGAFLVAAVYIDQLRRRARPR
jgi:ribose transport system permease protein